MKAAIVGYGVEGAVSARYWHDLGYEITVCKRTPQADIPSDYTVRTGDNYLDNLDQFDVIVRSAGIHPNILLKVNPGIESKITTNIEEFMRVSPTRNLIGVTGTKGKGTTSTLIAKMLRAAGFKAHILGNIGQPPLEIMSQIKQDHWVVLELSSFQLEDFKGPSPHIAVCLMVVPEHLNWHANMEEYLAAKGNLFKYQDADDYAIYMNGNENSKEIARKSPGAKLAYFSIAGAEIKDGFVEIEEAKICKTDDIKLRGKHNWQNVCAAVTAVWQITPDAEAIASVIKTFSGLEHRIEFVREVNGVSYYDDSFATTPETSIAAVQAFSEPKVLILGGSDKGISFEPLTDEVAKSNVKQVIAIGKMGTVIAEQLRSKGFNAITEGGKTMEEIVHQAHAHAEDGDVVLLSTGCASFDMFKDYKDRAAQFQTAVKAL